MLLLPPELAFRGCYPYPVAHPYDTYSCVDWEEPELQHWPAAAQVRHNQGNRGHVSPPRCLQGTVDQVGPVSGM